MIIYSYSRIFSSLHVSGERKFLDSISFFFSFHFVSPFHSSRLFSAELGQLSGVAAILRFPLPDIAEEEEDDEDDSDESGPD